MGGNIAASQVSRLCLKDMLLLPRGRDSMTLIQLPAVGTLFLLLGCLVQS